MLGILTVRPASGAAMEQNLHSVIDVMASNPVGQWGLRSLG